MHPVEVAGGVLFYPNYPLDFFALTDYICLMNRSKVVKLLEWILFVYSSLIKQLLDKPLGHLSRIYWSLLVFHVEVCFSRYTSSWMHLVLIYGNAMIQVKCIKQPLLFLSKIYIQQFSDVQFGQNAWFFCRMYSTWELFKVGAFKTAVAACVWFMGYFEFSFLWVFCGKCVYQH